jgi:Domain of unknown function (DUF4865)
MNPFDLTQTVLMQYETPLPDSFDLQQIRDRIERVAAPFDRLPGLWFKLYALNDRSHHPLNEYSSIYLWKNSAAMRDLLLSDLFHNYVETFARPVVRSWLPFHGEGNIGALGEARYALRQIFGIARQAPLSEVLHSWWANRPQRQALFRLVSFDSRSWEINDLCIWSSRPETVGEGRLYEIAHVSLPSS